LLWWRFVIFVLQEDLDHSISTWWWSTILKQMMKSSLC